MLTLFQVLLYILSIAQFFVFAHFILSWLISFQVLNLRQRFVAQVWYSLNRLLQPLYQPIRRILPDMGGLDLSPLIVLIGIYALQQLVVNTMFTFY